MEYDSRLFDFCLALHIQVTVVIKPVQSSSKSDGFLFRICKEGNLYDMGLLASCPIPAWGGLSHY